MASDRLPAPQCLIPRAVSASSSSGLSAMYCVSVSTAVS